MYRVPFARAALAYALIVAPAAHAATDADLSQLRDEIRQLKQAYEARIEALEARVNAAERVANRAAGVGHGAAAIAPVASLPAPATAAAATAAAASSANAFNPAISAVLEGVYSNLSQDPDRFALAGFGLGAGVSLGRRGLGLGESEFTLSANVDTRFAGNLTVALTPENTVSVEEAYGLANGLASGLVPKFGRFFSGIGYLNEQH